MKVATIEVKECGQGCPFFEDEDIDVGMGCHWTPPFCRKTKQDIVGDDREETFPSFCPLPNKENVK